MKLVLVILSFCLLIFSCESGKSTMNKNSGVETANAKKDTIHISNDALEYEILIIESGFDSWLVTQPPQGHFGLSLLESKNRRYVLEFNNRVNDTRYSSNLYSQRIEYNPQIRYGLEVNYLLYNYFEFFQQQYKQKL